MYATGNVHPNWLGLLAAGGVHPNQSWPVQDACCTCCPQTSQGRCHVFRIWHVGREGVCGPSLAHGASLMPFIQPMVPSHTTLPAYLWLLASFQKILTHFCGYELTSRSFKLYLCHHYHPRLKEFDLEKSLDILQNCSKRKHQKCMRHMCLKNVLKFHCWNTFLNQGWCHLLFFFFPVAYFCLQISLKCMCLLGIWILLECCACLFKDPVSVVYLCTWEIYIECHLT